MKKYFLSSMLVMGLMAPAFGADGKITGGAGTCTVDVLGVYDNNATANTIATWALNDYDCGAGQYLVIDDGIITCQPCPAGSYCPGGTYTVENADEGTNACPTGYKNSDAGASANTECYTNCTVANANIAHATAVTGNDYYGSGADTCTATDCELGYQVDGGEMTLVEKTPVIPVNYETAGTDYGYISSNGTASNATENGLMANNTWAVNFDYGRVYGRASCQPSADPACAYFFSNFEAVAGGTMSMEEFRTGVLAITSEAKANVIIDLAKAYSMAMTGQGDMTEAEIEEAFAKFFVTFSESSDKNYATDSTGQYCYCQMDGFTPATDGVLGEKTSVTSAPWVFNDGSGSAGDCASYCAGYCASSLRNVFVGGREFRAAVFGAFDAVEAGGMCKVTETDCPAGQYLAVVGDAMMCVPCKSGSYCPGGVYTIESENKGTNACPSGYPNSDTGAGADTQCYTACTLETANIAHATAVSGNDYYGSGVDTCGATACETGYHVDGGGLELVEKDPLIPVDYTLTGDGMAAIDPNGSSIEVYLPDAGLTENGTWAAHFDYGTVYGKASCQPKIDPALEYIDNNESALIGGQMSFEDFLTGLEPLAGPVKTEYVKNTFIGYATGAISEEELNKRAFGVFYMEPNANYATDSTGQHCYCQMDGFTPTGGTKQTVTSAPWVFIASDDKASTCANICANYCATSLQSDDVYSTAFRGVVYGALGYTEETATCAANTINIDWNPDNGGDHTQNMCLYDGAITLPTPDPVKPGYVFSGWKLVPKTTTE